MMRKHLQLLLALLVVLHVQQAQVTAEENVDDASKQENLDEPKPLDAIPSIAESFEDEPAELTESEISHLEDDSSLDSVKSDDDEVDDSVDEKNDDQNDKKERKIVERGWRRRRWRIRIRIRRRRRTPAPRPTPSPFRRCGRSKYNIRTHSCCFNRFLRPKGKCPVFHCTRLRPRRVSVTYNPYTHRCCYGFLRSRSSRCPVYRCGRYRYNPRFIGCCRRGWISRPYNIYTHQCCHGIPIAKCYKCHPWARCGLRLYSPWLYRCCAGRHIYSFHFQKCCHNHVIDKQALCLRRG